MFSSDAKIFYYAVNIHCYLVLVFVLFVIHILLFISYKIALVTGQTITTSKLCLFNYLQGWIFFSNLNQCRDILFHTRTRIFEIGSKISD